LFPAEEMSVPQHLVDVLWRNHPAAPAPSRRGPRSRLTADDVVAAATVLADTGGLDAVRLRDLATELEISTMSVYTHVNSREDLVVLMVDAALATAERPVFGRRGWRARVRQVADAHLDLHTRRPWLLDVRDPRVVLGPGAVAAYEVQLHAFDGTGLDDITRDAALTFVLEFATATARDLRRDAEAVTAGEFWSDAAPRLARYLADDPYPLAGRVGQAAGEHMNAAASARHAYDFGMRRVLDGLATLI
jgi:AcrR family transcriptional regulator